MKILASDFDGTLYFEHQLENYRQDDLEAIKKFQSYGHKFGVCTGRPLIGVTDFASSEFTFDFYIVNSGAIVLDQDFKVISKKDIALTTIKDVYEHYQGIEMLIATVDKLFMANIEADFDNPIITRLTSLKQLHGETILSFSLLLKNEAYARKVKKTLEKYEDLEVFQNINAIDCAPKDCSKKSGIQIIQEYYQVDKNDLACIGDSYNDICMLEYLDNSFTFDYSPKEVQEAAKNVVRHLDECVEKLLGETEK